MKLCALLIELHVAVTSVNADVSVEAGEYRRGGASVYYIRQSKRSETAGYTVITFVCLSVCLSVYVSVCTSPVYNTGLNGRNDVLFADKCIRLVCEKLTVFPYEQDIVGNIFFIGFLII